MFEFKQEQFSGPLDLLLSLIETEELDITEVNLSKIADDYVSYIRASETEIRSEEISDFLVLAARLLFLKSKALLPYLLSDDDEADLEIDLAKQLRMFREYKEASEKLKQILLAENFLFIPENIKVRSPKIDLAKFSQPATPIPLTEFAKLMQAIIERRLESREQALEEESLVPKISIEEKIEAITELLNKKIKFNFSTLLESAKNKTEVIVSFLAMLELAKQKKLAINQSSLFSDIQLTKYLSEE